MEGRETFIRTRCQSGQEGFWGVGLVAGVGGGVFLNEHPL